MKLPAQLQEEKRGSELFHETAEQWDLGFEDPGPIGHAAMGTQRLVVAAKP